MKIVAAVGIISAIIIAIDWVMERLMTPADLHDWDNDEWWKEA